MKLSTAVTVAVKDLQQEHGSIRGVGLAIGIDSGYLCKLMSGEKKSASDNVLRLLKIKKTVDYDY